MTYWERFLKLLPAAAMVLLVGQAACIGENPRFNEGGMCTPLTAAQAEVLECNADLMRLCPKDRNDAKMENIANADECPGPTTSIPCLTTCTRNYLCDNGNCRPGEGGICDCTNTRPNACEGSCASGFLCQRYRGSWGKCAVDPNNPPDPVPGCGANKSCTPGADCPKGDECASQYICQATCRIPLGQPGCAGRNDLCVANGLCQSGTCVGDIGASCSGAGQCKNGLVCSGGRCGLPDGSACAMTAQCSPGLYCYNLAADAGTAKCHAPCLRQSTGQQSTCGPDTIGCGRLCNVGELCDPGYCAGGRQCSQGDKMIPSTWFCAG